MPQSIVSTGFNKGKGKGKGKSNKDPWRPTKVECAKGFICHIKSTSEIETCIAAKKKTAAAHDSTLQPFVVIVGPDFRNISAHYVYVNDIKYLMDSTVGAVDCCFKLFQVLNAKYPPESHNTWFFIQKAFYNITTEYDDKDPIVVNTLFAELSIPTAEDN